MAGIKSAAYCQSSDFALSSHDHDIFTSAVYVSELPGGGKTHTVLSIDDITTNPAIHHTVDISSVIDGDVPDIKKTELLSALSSYLPKLGTAQFICARDIGPYLNYLNPTKSSFVGWVLADGAIYDLTSFMLSTSIQNVFQVNGTKFSVPDFRNAFCKLDCQPETNSSYDIIEHEFSMPGHAHGLTLEGGLAKITLDTTGISADEAGLNNMFNNMILETSHNPEYEISVNKKTDKLSLHETKKNNFYAIHNGTKSGTTIPVELVDQQEWSGYQINNLAIVPEQGTDDDNEYPYPAHMMMPIVIYVGPSISSDIVATYVTNSASF